MTPSEAALDRVHTLYILQTKFITSLDDGLHSGNKREELMQDIRTFQKLLNQADWRYMGGEDVLDSLRALHGEVKAKLRSPSTKKAAKKKAIVVKAKKVTKKVVKKSKKGRKSKRK